MANPLHRYLKAAFNLRTPISGLGQVPLNWLAILLIAFLSLFNIGFLLLGSALEITYLMLLSHHPNFRRLVDGQTILAQESSTASQREEKIQKLSASSRQRYQELLQRTNAMPQNQDAIFGSITRNGLAKLHDAYLLLLSANEELGVYLAQSSHRELAEKLDKQQRRLDTLPQDNPIRRSTEETIRILERRLENRANAEQRAEYIESELLRIEQQADLILEDAALSKDPQSLSQRIDAVTATYDNSLDMMRHYHLDFTEELEESVPGTGPSGASSQRSRHANR